METYPKKVKEKGKKRKKRKKKELHYQCRTQFRKSQTMYILLLGAKKPELNMIPSLLIGLFLVDLHFVGA